MGLSIKLRRNSRPVVSGSWLIVNAISKMTPQVIHPRPDAETPAWARCRRAPSGIPWAIPIVVQGGAWPFKYEILDNGGATGLTITETAPLDFHTNGLGEYGVLSLDNPVVGTYVIVIRVTDQNLVEVERTFTLEVISRENATYFCFIAATGGSNSNNGAYSTPKLNHTGWYGPNKNDSTHQNKQVFFFAGTYNSTDFAVIGGSFGQQIDMTSVKPHVFVAIPGESVTFDNNSTAYWEYETHPGDGYFEGMTWINPSVIENSAVRKTHVRFSTNPDRTTLFRVHFISNSDVPGDSTNSAGVMFGGNPDPASYFAISQCIFDSFYNQDLGLFYDTRDVVIEGCSVINGYGSSTGGSAGGFFFKAVGILRVTCRANRGIGAGISLPLMYFSQFVPAAGDERTDLEFCWNNYRNDSTRTVAEGAGAVGIGQSDGLTGNNYGPFWSYRNNMRVAHTSIIGIGEHTPAPGPFEFENDVIQHSGTYTDGFYFLSSSQMPAQLVKTDLATGTAMVDSTTNLLTGTARDNYLGTHGCEFEYL